jgi:hypothetical protein
MYLAAIKTPPETHIFYSIYPFYSSFIPLSLFPVYGHTGSTEEWNLHIKKSLKSPLGQLGGVCVCYNVDKEQSKAEQ